MVITMRKSITRTLALALAIIMMIALVACGNNQPATADTPADSEPTEKVLKIGELWNITGIDPVNNGTLMKEKAPVVETLVEVDENFGLVGGLATAWESTDSNTWVITIREGVKFHNGDTLTAEDVAWSLNHAFECNPTHATKSLVTEIKATGDYEITITTSSPNAEIPEYLHTAGLGIVHKDSYDESGELITPIGTGPFSVDSFDSSIGVLTIVKNTDYWNGEASVDKVILTGMTDSSTRALALESGEIDFTCDLPFNELSRLDSLDNVYVDCYDTARVYAVYFNCGDSKFADKEVRQAISLIVDRETIANDVLFGAGSPSKNIFTDNMAWNNTSIDCSEYNLEKGVEMLNKAGWTDSDSDGILDKDGKPFEFTIYTYVERPGLPLIAEALQAMLGEVGIKVEIVTQASGTFNKEVVGTDTEWGMYIAGMATAQLPSCYNFLDNNYATRNTEKYGYSNPEFDTLLEKCKAEFDTEARYEISRQIQELAIDELNIMYVCNYGVSYGFNSSVSNFKFNPTAHDYQWNTDITIG